MIALAISIWQGIVGGTTGAAIGGDSGSGESLPHFTIIFF